MRDRPAMLCFFLSGFAGLVYEVCWIRRASLVFGSTIWGLSTVLAVFFGGLALGSWIFGRLGQRTARPVRTFAFLELVVAASALATLVTLPWTDRLFGAAYRGTATLNTDAAGLTWLEAGPGLAVVRVLLVALVLLPPTVAMGGTLPLLCRQFVRRRDRIAGGVGVLYGINTLGAAAGTATAGFLLVPTLGLTWTLVAAAGLNLVVALTALRLDCPEVPVLGGTDADEPAKGPAGTRTPLTAAVVPGLFFLAGLVAVGAEVVWSRFLALLVPNSIYTYTITLTVVLVGIVLGSLLVARLRENRTWKDRSPASLFGFCQIAAGLLLVLLMYQPAAFWRGLGGGLAPYFLLMLPGAVLSGASFPLAIRMVLDDPRFTAARVGRMTAANTAGGIAGSLAAGFLLLPALGLDGAVRVLALFGILTGTAAWLVGRAGAAAAVRRRPRLAVGTGIAALALWFVLPGASGTRLPQDHLARGGGLVDHAEGLGSTLAVVDLDGTLQLEIDNLWQGSAVKGHQIMAAHLPALLHGRPDSVLVIGVGVGQTAGRFLYHGVSSLDCVDIEREIFPFIRRHFDTAWIQDERTTLVADDGRTFTAHTDRRYDLISVEAGQVFRPGIDVFYNREFYRSARARLRPGGMVSQFVPLGYFDTGLLRSVLATFLEVFPEASLWYNTRELLLVGGRDRQPRLDPARLESLAAGGGPDAGEAAVARDLAFSHWDGARYHLDRPGVLPGSFLAGSAELAALAAGADVLTDDRADLAYATSGVGIDDHADQESLALLRRHLGDVPEGLSGPLAPETLATAERVREINLRDIVASQLVAEAVSGQGRVPYRETLALLRRALEENPESYLGHYNTGKLLLMNNRPDRAEPFLKRAAGMRPDAGRARRDLGLALVRMNAPERALPHLDAAVRLLPRDAAARNYRGTALALQGRLNEAIVEFEQALDLAPGDAGIAANLNRTRELIRTGARP